MIKIREYTFYDINQIVKCGKNNLPLFYGIFDMLINIFNTNQICYVAEENNNICGFIIAECEKIEGSKNVNIHIQSIGVNKNKRCKNIGSRLIERLKQNYHKQISLYVKKDNIRAISFYKKNNFEVIEKKINYYKNYFKNESNDAYLMKLIKL
tara:strand:- start:579 stop:1037 length:459 start_codon:yes stop_codon:yes gene_type:complete